MRRDNLCAPLVDKHAISTVPKLINAGVNRFNTKPKCFFFSLSKFPLNLYDRIVFSFVFASSMKQQNHQRLLG